MIQNESLSDRLNGYKNNSDKQIGVETNYASSNINIKTSLSNSIILLLAIAIKSFAFGYSLKTIMHADWNFFGYFCVGLSITFLSEFILDVIALFSNN